MVTSDAGTGFGYTGIRIRGTDPTRINVTINGIPLNDSESQGVFWVDLPDFISSADDVQIQRGVGTSTNGAGAFGATINLSTTQMRPDAYARVTGSAGSFNTLKTNVQFGTGHIKDRFAVEGRLSRITSDGYIDRAEADLRSYFLSASYLGDKSRLHANVFSGHEITYQAWYGVPPELLSDPETRTFNPAGTEKPGTPHEDEVDNYRQTHAQLMYNWQVADEWDLNLSGHYTRGKGFFEQYKAGESFSSYGLEPVRLGGETFETTDLIRRLWLDNDFYGLTYSAIYQPLGERFDLTLGGGYNIYEGAHFGEIIWAELALNIDQGMRYYDNDATKTDFNTFAKVNYRLAGRWNAFADLQYRRVFYEFLGFNRRLESVVQDAELHFFNPKLGLSRELGDRGLIYASFAVANREPNRNDFVNTTPAERPEPEHLYNTELGFRKSWTHAALGANLYHMYYRDQLALNGQINDVGEYTRVNIDKSYRLGIELVGGGRLAPGLEFNGNLTLSRNKVNAFTEFVDVYDEDFNYLGQEQISRENTDLAFSPSVISGSELTYSLLREMEDHQLDISWLTKYVSRQYIDNTSDEDNAIDPYTFTDLRLRYRLRLREGPELALTLLARNIFNALYEANAWSYRYVFAGQTVLDQGFFPQAGRNFLVGLSAEF